MDRQVWNKYIVFVIWQNTNIIIEIISLQVVGSVVSICRNEFIHCQNSS